MIGNLSRGHFSHAGNVFTETLNNHGVSFSGNNLQGSTVFFGGSNLSTEEQCKKALFLTNPTDDRGAIMTAKPRLVPQVCQWIYENAIFQDWMKDQTSAQLLWLAGGSGMGKTMMSLYLLHQLEKDPMYAKDTAILYYFVDNRNEKRNTAVSILRGLIYLLLRSRPELIDHLLSDFEYQREALFGQNSLEALWRNFQAMIKDEATGNVVCLIDALDECREDSLQPFLRKICDFFDAQNHSDELDKTEASNSTTRNSVKMVLVSREIPTCLSECLSQFPRVQVGVIKGGSKLSKKSSRSTLRRKWTVMSAKQQRLDGPPKLATAAQLVLQKKRLDQANGAATAHARSPMRSTLERPFDEFSFSQDLVESATALEQEFKQLSENEKQSTSKRPSPEMAEVSGVAPLAPPSSGSSAKIPTKKFEEYIFDEDVDEEDIADKLAVDETGGNEPLQPLELYIETKVTEMSQEKGLSEVLALSLWEGLNSGGDGTFLWVDLAVNEIKRHEPERIEEVLDTLPPDVDGMYCHTLRNIPPTMVDLTVAILRWVVTARRPLSLIELSAALVLMGFRGDKPIEMINRGIAACGPLLFVDKNDIVHLTHTSVKDLLTQRSGLLSNDPTLIRFQVNMEEFDQQMASYCITYLEQGCLNKVSASTLEDEAEFNKHQERFPLFSYAFIFWPTHLRSASRVVVDLSSPFFAKNSSIRKTWWHLYYSTITHRSSYLAPQHFTLLHMAAHLNLTVIADQIQLQGGLQTRLNSRDSHGSTPLAVATEAGSMNMFVFLMQRGASHECVNQNVFELACRKGQREIVEYLLDSGYDANCPVKIIPFSGLLSSWTRWAHGMVNELMTMDNDQLAFLCGDPRIGWTPLHLVCLFGYVPVAELLLNRGASVNVKTTNNLSALHSAAWGGRLACVKLLIEKGGNPAEVTKDGWNAMHCAARRGKVNVVTFLLEIGTPADAVTSKQKTALHIAAKNGNAATLQALMAGGARLDVKTHRGETPLHIAARSGHPEAVETLLAGGAFRSVTNSDGKSPADSIRPIKGTLNEKNKEILRILETYGEPNYVPWKPTGDKDDSDTPREKLIAQQLAPPPTRRVALPKSGGSGSPSSVESSPPIPPRPREQAPVAASRIESATDKKKESQTHEYPNQPSLAQPHGAAGDFIPATTMFEGQNENSQGPMFLPPPPNRKQGNSLTKKTLRGLRGLLK